MSATTNTTMAVETADKTAQPVASGQDAAMAPPSGPVDSSKSFETEDNVEDNPWVRRFLDDEDTQHVSQGLVPRTAKLLRRIANEGDRRGYLMMGPDDAGLAVDHEENTAWAHIVLRKDETVYFMQIHEVAKTGMPAREPFSRNPGKTSLPMWIDERNREFVGTGVLMLEIRSENSQWHQRTCRDSGHSLIEDRLERVFDSMDRVQERLEFDRRCREANERRKRERYATYRSMMLNETLKQRADEYAAWLRQKDYLDVLEREATRREDTVKGSLFEDIAMLREQVEKVDPFNDPDGLAFDIPMPSDYEIEAYLRQRQEAQYASSDSNPYAGGPSYGGMRHSAEGYGGYDGYGYEHGRSHDGVW